MTKLIAIFIIVLVVVAGFKLVGYYKQVEEENRQQHKAEIGADVRPELLEGMPYQLSQSWDAAQKNGVSAMRDWFKYYGPQVQDPRKAWIQLDYCLAAMRDDPNEARAVFQSVKERTATNSPVYPRIRQLERTFE